jgi:hypothetical protein
VPPASLSGGPHQKTKKDIKKNICRLYLFRFLILFLPFLGCF